MKKIVAQDEGSRGLIRPSLKVLANQKGWAKGIRMAERHMYLHSPATPSPAELQRRRSTGVVMIKFPNTRQHQGA